jgi:uncharacterized protein (TIGR03083 family)
MPTTMYPAEHIEAIRANGRRLVELAVEAGLGAPVPSCPGWSVAALVAHQTMVHRWATAHVRGDDPELVPTESDIERTVSDLPAYYRQGHAGLCDALTEAPDDLDAMTFLNDAPPPRAFWARRQAHETTIHLADALAASLGRLPDTGELGVAPALATDGIDELLRGFFTRGRSKLYDGTEQVIDIAASDTAARWTLHVGPRLRVEPAGQHHGEGEADATISGTAAGLYLALWNRGTDVAIAGRADLIDRWRASQRVTWS